MEARDIIMKHYMHPINRMRMDNQAYIKANTRNESCIDNIDLYVKFNDKVIEDITFDGEACAISISSTSIMIENLIGKTCEEAIYYIHEFYKMTNKEEYDKNVLGSALVYGDIVKEGHRQTCANLPLKGLEKAILEHLK